MLWQITQNYCKFKVINKIKVLFLFSEFFKYGGAPQVDYLQSLFLIKLYRGQEGQRVSSVTSHGDFGGSTVRDTRAE
jgi:hypothetical protein